MRDRDTNRSKKNKKNKKKMKVWKKVLLVILLILVIAIGWFIYKTNKNGGGVSGMLATVVGHDENTRKNLPELKVLILGVSDGIDAKLSDTIMVASYNPNTQKATLLSIPRDTFTGTNTATATPNQKINAIYSLTQNPEKVLKAVNDITNLDIQYYLVIETTALRKLVDSVGGVQFDVPIDMNYDDSAQNLHIHVNAGQQTLNGEQAEGVVRFRHNNNGTTYSSEYGDNDVGRMKTQREFLKSVMQQTLKLENIFKIGEWLDIANENVKTNIDISVAKDYIPYVVEFSTDNLLTDTLPGEPKLCNGVWVYVYYKNETKTLVQKLFYDRDIVEDEDTQEDGNTTNETSNTTSSTEKSSDEITIELLNGTGSSKTLSTVTEKLKKAGYNVTKTGTTNETSKTTIVNKKNVTETELKKIKTEVGVGTISTSKSSSSKVDVTIILGTDCK